MTERSYPFDAGDGSAIDELQWSYMARSWQTNGVDSPGPGDNSLKVETTGQPFTLLVRAGHAKLAGFHYHLDTDQTVLFEENASTGVRVDRVVLSLDRETNKIALVVKTGVTGSSTPPIVDRSWETPEIPLAVYTVRAGSDTVLSADLLDAREFVSNGVQMLPASAAPGARKLATGEIGYDPVADKFYAQMEAEKRELGAQVDLSPYLTKSSAASTYMPLTYSSGVPTMGSNWFSEAVTWQKVGRITFVSGLIAYQENKDESVPQVRILSIPYDAGPTAPVLVTLTPVWLGYDYQRVGAWATFRRSGGVAEMVTNSPIMALKGLTYGFQAVFASG